MFYIINVLIINQFDMLKLILGICAKTMFRQFFKAVQIGPDIHSIIIVDVCNIDHLFHRLMAS